MSDRIDLRVQRGCAWGGAFMITALCGGFLIAGFIPPPGPGDDPAQIAARYTEDATAIRIGMYLAMFGSAFLVPFIVVIFRQMLRIGPAAHTLAWVQLATGIVGIFIFFVPMMIAEVAAFRPDTRAPDTIQTLNDICWLMFVGTWALGFVQFLATGLGFLFDRRPADPVFPRWGGYFNLWMMITLSVPSGLVVFFHDGPFAWIGLISWWIPVSAFVVWTVVMVKLVLDAIAHQEREEATGDVEPAALSA